MRFMREHIPIAEVAEYLGLKLAGNSAHCWRIEHHQHGDRTPSISFRKNKATCYVCDARPLSTLDLVSAHEKCDLMTAVSWICARFSVPSVPKGKKLIRSERWRAGRVGVSRFPLEELVRSGKWAELSDATRAVLPVMCCFADGGGVEISYRGLARYSGKRSDHRVADAIKELEHLGLLKVTRARNGSFRECGRYMLDWNDERFQSVLASCHEAMKAERDSERTLRAQSKAAKGITRVVLSAARDSVNEVHAAVRDSVQIESVAALKTSHCIQRQCAVSQDSKNQEFKNSRVWEPPTFEEITRPKDARGTDFPFGWNVGGARA